MEEQIIEADLTWTGTCFEPELQVGVSKQGCIETVGKRSLSPTLKLEGQALIPGFVNVHSHAFQRGLRGKGEKFPQGSGSFWSWRESMYELVSRIDQQSLYQLCRQAFAEMLDSGITTVGEFHYLHHESSQRPYALDETVLQAAHETGIRIVLLQTYYKTGAIGQALKGAQLAFRSDSPSSFWLQVESLQRLTAGRSGQVLGIAAHSVRAAPVEEISELYRQATSRRMVFHIHLEEQRREIEDCRKVWKLTPSRLVSRALNPTDNFTAVHCTHTAPSDLAGLLSRGANICLCPLTEANLGDGIADVPQIQSLGGTLCLGTDSNSRLSMFEEMRWLEYVQRLKLRRRGVVMDAGGDPAALLLRMATENGGRALGLKTGAIRPGWLADFAALRLDAAQLSGYSAGTLPTSLVFGADPAVVSAVCVGGRWTDCNRPARS